MSPVTPLRRPPRPGTDTGTGSASGRLLEDLRAAPGEETVTTLLQQGGVRIERIVSLDYASPRGFWYDQTCHEWVMVIAGSGEVEFDDGRTIRLEPGECLDLPAGCRHRVSWTDPDSPTVWLAVRIDPD